MPAVELEAFSGWAAHCPHETRAAVGLRGRETGPNGLVEAFTGISVTPALDSASNLLQQQHIDNDMMMIMMGSVSIIYWITIFYDIHNIQ